MHEMLGAQGIEPTEGEVDARDFGLGLGLLVGCAHRFPQTTSGCGVMPARWCDVLTSGDEPSPSGQRLATSEQQAVSDRRPAVSKRLAGQRSAPTRFPLIAVR